MVTKPILSTFILSCTLSWTLTQTPVSRTAHHHAHCNAIGDSRYAQHKPSNLYSRTSCCHAHWHGENTETTLDTSPSNLFHGPHTVVPRTSHCHAHYLAIEDTDVHNIHPHSPKRDLPCHMFAVSSTLDTASYHYLTVFPLACTISGHSLTFPLSCNWCFQIHLTLTKTLFTKIHTVIHLVMR
jgi:hypothetical protein